MNSKRHGNGNIGAFATWHTRLVHSGRKGVRRDVYLHNMELYLSVYIHIHTYIYAHTFWGMYIYMHTHIYTYIYIYSYIYICTYVYTYMYICIYTCIHVRELAIPAQETLVCAPPSGRADDDTIGVLCWYVSDENGGA